MENHRRAQLGAQGVASVHHGTATRRPSRFRKFQSLAAIPENVSPRERGPGDDQFFIEDFYLNYGCHLIAEHIEQFDVGWNSLELAGTPRSTDTIRSLAERGQPVDQGDDYILHVHTGLQLGAGLEKRVERL